jgi:hypothetical protein
MAPNTRSEQLQLVSEGGVNLSLRMTDRSMNDIDVLDIDGRIVLGEESNAFREKVKSMLAAGKKRSFSTLQISAMSTAQA